MNKKRICPRSKINSTMDWRYTNTELVYKGNLGNECEENSPSRMKIKHNYSCSNDANIDLFTNLNLKNVQESMNNYDNKVNDVSKLLNEKFGTSSNTK